MATDALAWSLDAELRAHLEAQGHRAQTLLKRHRALERLIAEREGYRLTDTERSAQETVASAGDAVDALLADAAGHMAREPWGAPSWETFEPVAHAHRGPRLTRVGTLTLKAAEAETEVPAMVPILGAGNLYLRPSVHNHAPMRRWLELIALRLLAGVPAGRMRLTLIDPVGLGQNFANLLRLDEFIRGTMAWHKTSDIYDALEEVTSHLSTMIQRYLRNEYADIDAYNQAVNAIAEPYRLVLVSDFPSGFDAKAAQALASIAQNGPRVGVHVLMTWAEDQTLADPSPLRALREHAMELIETGPDTYAIAHPALRQATLTLDAPPSRETINRITDSISTAGRLARKVVVGLDRLLPSERWATSSAESLEIPIGQSGTAPHALRLGLDTAHHALIGGTTGSGKSVLLHTLILSAAARYSPEELELYLIDFKEGVEFIGYQSLPHARVVAVQSDRAFGLSVLQGLVGELNARGERFRKAGVAHIHAFREATGESLPRVLMVIDEFQVFFSRNDRLAQQARKLLDTVARQGRSFGVHLVLASQTLLSVHLDPGTLPQLGVRIALRMGEADAARILGRDNDAPRYLERPGEAIYNAQAGQVGANRRIQIAFSSPAERDGLIAELRDDAQARGWASEPIVFEGGRLADFNKVRQELALGAIPSGQVPFYLGEPLRVHRAHLRIDLRRQSRANVAIAGQADEVAAAIVHAGLHSAQIATPVQVQAIDLTIPESAGHGALALDDAEVSPRDGLEALLSGVAEELDRRIQNGGGAPTLIVLWGVHAADKLRKDGYRPSPLGATLARVVRDGPEHGLHVILWSATVARLMDIFDNKQLAELGYRIAVAGGDSGQLLPVAHRAAEVSADDGWLNVEGSEDIERFRRYK